MSEEPVAYQVRQTPSSDERLFALLSFLSLILGGFILPIVIWATQKDKSQFVRFHSLQAIFFHLALIAIFVILIILMVLVMLVFGGGIGFMSASANDPAAFSVFLIVFMIVFYGGMIILSLAAVAYSVYLAIKSNNGYWIKIPVIGNIIWNKINRSH
jgi:uncharacterized Tic20 family protein